MNQEQTFRFGSFEVQPGEKKSGFITIGEGEFELPVTIINGKESGKTALITAGVHAGEYVGIQAAAELSQRIKPEKVAGAVVIVNVLNRQAFENRSGSMGYEDHKNLNRVFPGNPGGTQMERLAYAIEKELFPIADFYMDLHSGDDYEKLTPYVYYAGMAEESVAAVSRSMAEQVDVPYMVRSTVSTGGCYNYAASLGIPSILIKRGSMGGWTLEESHSTRRDVRNILCYLGIYLGQRDYRNYYPLEVKDLTYQFASCAGLWYPTKLPGDMVQRGEVLGVVKNYQGETLEVSIAQYDGVILYQTGSLQVLESGPMITYGRISYEKDNRKERITNYWTRRSDSFKEQRKAELHSPMAKRWKKEIFDRLPDKKGLKILDVGCGAGFFSILLAKEGHQVTGVDLTPDMIKYSIELAREEGADCRFFVMDAEKLDFEEESFDVIISRNLTWTLPNAHTAYKEWMRVLKKDGILLNFDANYGAEDFSDTKSLPQNHAHHTLGDVMMQECEEIKRQLPISTYMRPAWDLEVLGKMGPEQFSIDLGISKRVYVEKDEFYNPTPLFVICAKK